MCWESGEGMAGGCPRHIPPPQVSRRGRVWGRGGGGEGERDYDGVNAHRGLRRPPMLPPPPATMLPPPPATSSWCPRAAGTRFMRPAEIMACDVYPPPHISYDMYPPPQVYAACINNGGDLASIHGQEEAAQASQVCPLKCIRRCC